MNNPFKYGGTVSGIFFADREKEKKELIQEIKSSTNVFLYSPRRYGKSSLVLQVLEEVRKQNIIGIYVDLMRAPTKEKFYELYAKEIAKATTRKIEEAVVWCRKLFSHFIPKIILKNNKLPDIEFEVNWSKKNDTLIGEEILETPQKIADLRKQKVAVIFDEFCEIEKYNGLVFEGFLRSFIQHHRDVAYIFTASKTHLLMEMIGSKRPFYRLGKMRRLDKISEEEFKDFVRERFTMSKITIDHAGINKIFAITQNHPCYTQMLCHEIWNRVQGRHRVTHSDIEIALEDIIHHQNEYFFARWDILSEHQKKLLLAIVVSGGENIFSKDFINSNNLGSASAVQRSVNRLIEIEVLEKINNKFYIVDIFFEHWLKRTII